MPEPYTNLNPRERESEQINSFIHNAVGDSERSKRAQANMSNGHFCSKCGEYYSGQRRGHFCKKISFGSGVRVRLRETGELGTITAKSEEEGIWYVRWDRNTNIAVAVSVAGLELVGQEKVADK
jgi:hypothetical protein